MNIKKQKATLHPIVALTVCALIFSNAGTPASAQTDNANKSAVATKLPPPASAEKGVPPAQSSVDPEVALRKIHPRLRDVARAAAPALPARLGATAAASEPVLIQVIAREGTDLSAYFKDGKVLARPPFGKGEARNQMFFGYAEPWMLLKIATLPAVQAILPIVLERTNEPEPYPADDTQPAAPKPGPEQWAKLRADAEKVRAGSLPWQQARAFGDGRPSFRPQDWFEVRPAGPHKAEAAWARGYTGEGVTVAVLDDGIDPAHPDLLGTHKIYSSTEAPQYNGWPYVFSPISMLLYAFDDFFGTTYIADGFPGAHYVDTRTARTPAPCGPGIRCFQYTPLIDYGTLNPYAPPGGYTYVISSTMSKSGVVRVGTHPDNDLRDFLWGEKVAVLLTDPNTAGVYDTVYVDLDADYDFRDEKPLRRANVNNPATYNDMVAYRDLNNDGLADISGGMLYFIADGVTPIPVSDWMYGGLTPGNADLVAFSGSTFDRSYSHGTQCASNIVGQGVSKGLLPTFSDLPGTGKPPAAVYGMAPDAKVVNVSDIYYNFDSSILDAYIFTAIGYDGLDQTDPDDSDAIQISTNSYGTSDVDNDGWEYEGQVASQVQRLYGPNLQMLFSTGNGASAYGTVAPPTPASGIGVGASTEFGSTGWDSITRTDQIVYGDVIPFSNRGPGARGTNGVDVVAGGAFAAGAEELNYYSISTWGAPNGDLSWASWGGTSRSAPVAGGVLALIYQAYRDRTGEWPTYDVARALLKASATDLEYDTLTQGSGSVNADRGTAVASGLQGFYVTPDEWVPGNYRGQDWPGFAHIVYPGNIFTTPITVTNPTTASVNVSITDAELLLIGSRELTYTVTPAMIAAQSAYGAANRDNFYKAFNFFIPITADIGFATQWYNVPIPPDTDLMIIRQTFPFTRFDVNGDYQWDQRFVLNVYNWSDENNDGNLWEDRDGNGVVNFINSGVVSQIDGAEELVWNDPRTELDRWEYVRFAYHRPGGNRNEVWIQNPVQRMDDGMFIGIRHLYRPNAATLTTTLRYRIEFYKKSDVPWLSLSSGSVSVPATGSAAVQATVNVPANMPPGVYQAGLYFNDGTHTSVVPVVLNVAAVFTNGLTFGGQASYVYDANRPYNNGAVRGLFDWTWRAESGDWRFFFFDLQNCTLNTVFTENFDSVSAPALPPGWATQTVTGTSGLWGTSTATVNPSGQPPVSAPNLVYFNSYDASAGHATRLYRTSGLDLSTVVAPELRFQMYHDTEYINNDRVQVQVSTNGGLTWQNVGAPVPRYDGSTGWKLHTVSLAAFAGQPDVRIALLGISAFGNDVHLDDVGVHDVTCAYPVGTKMLVKDEWQAPAPNTDIDTIVLGPTPTSLGSGLYDVPEPTYYGPYVLDTVAKSPNRNTSAGVWRFDTSSGANQDWVAAPFPDWRPDRGGLHAVLQHNVLFEGTRHDVVFTKTLGTLRSAPASFVITTYVNSGLVGTATLTAGIALNGVTTTGFLVSPTVQTWTNEPLGFVGSSTIEWTYTFNLSGAYSLQLNTSSALADIDLYLFRWTGSAWQMVAASAGTTSNESITLIEPPNGTWLIGVDNYSGPAGTFNLTMQVGNKVGGLSFAGAPSSAVPAGTPVTFTIHYSYPMQAGGVYSGFVFAGPPEAPLLVPMPVTIYRLANSGRVEKSVNYNIAFPGDSLQYVIRLYNFDDVSATFQLYDPIPAQTTFVTVTNASYDSLANAIVYSGTLPLGAAPPKAEGFEGGAVPPAGWGEQISNASYNWAISTLYKRTGTYGAYVPWNYSQDEWLLSPPLLGLSGGMTVSLWSQGSVYWCRTPNDNCDLRVWLVANAVGGGDDVLLGQPDNEWTASWTWQQSVYTLPASLPAGSLRIGFQYFGDDGADVGLDDIFLPGTPQHLPSRLITVTVQITNTAAGAITNTAMLTVTHSRPQGLEVEPMHQASAVTVIGAPNLSSSTKSAPTTLVAGSLLTYTIQLVNSGSQLVNVTLTDTIPTSTTFVSLDNTPPNHTFSYNSALNRVQWTGNLAPGQTRTFQFTVQVPAGPSLWNKTITNTVYVTWGNNVLTRTATTLVHAPKRAFVPIARRP
ncbi:MAG: S8 family serine peptidase [Anaerolineae bacterium]|nr:S8 family serine peptidase [Anaerolineae bacterium]